MFADTMSAAIDAARTLTQLDHLSRDIWKAWGSGQIGDEAQLLAMQLEARRKALRGEIKPVGIPPDRPSIFPPRRPQRAPVRAVAIARRRHLAASGPMPPALASRFTVGELAVLRIVGDEERARKVCGLHIDAIAARAGVCRTKAKQAIRQAKRLGMIEVQERRRQGAKSLTNLITIVDREWSAWLKRAGRIGGTFVPTTDNQVLKGKRQSVSGPPQEAAGRQGRARVAASQNSGAGSSRWAVCASRYPNGTA